MSTTLNKAIRRRLTGQDALTGDGLEAQLALEALLAADPSSSGNPAVYIGNMASSPVFPCITFRPSGGISSWISRSEDIGVVGQPEYEFEIWGQAEVRNPDPITNIFNYLEQLLDDRHSIVDTFPFLTLDAGWYCVAGICLMDLSLNFDTQRNAWFGLTRFQFIVQRYKQGS